MSLPSKLNKVTIVDVNTECRFQNRNNIEDVFFEIYGMLKSDGYEYTKLPIMELPQAVREGDGNLEFLPYYRIHKGKYVINIGPKILSFSIQGYYPGWEDYKTFIVSKFKRFENIIESWGLERTSIRYINFFENQDILDKLKINMSLPEALCGEKHVIGKRVLVNEVVCKDGTIIKVQIANETNIKIGTAEESKEGSLIDIDTFSSKKDENIDVVVDNLHDKAKSMFFGLLEEDLLKSLEPEYKG